MMIRIVWGLNRLMLAISRSPVTQGLIRVVGGLFTMITTVFGGIGKGMAAVARGFVAIFSAPGRIVEMSRDGIGALRNRGERKERKKVVAKAKAVAKPKNLPPKATAPKQLAAPKAKAPAAPGSKKSPLGFFEDRPINKS
jgi:hypothetical protein